MTKSQRKKCECCTWISFALHDIIVGKGHAGSSLFTHYVKAQLLRVEILTLPLMFDVFNNPFFDSSISV